MEGENHRNSMDSNAFGAVSSGQYQSTCTLLDRERSGLVVE